jgi:hypothetical protein
MMRGCENTVISTTPINSPGVGPPGQSGASSAIPRRVSFGSLAGEKNRLRDLRDRTPRLLRPPASAGAGPLLWRYAGVPGAAGPAGPVPPVWNGEAGGPAFPRRQPLLHEAVRLRRRPALSHRQHQGRGDGAAPGLAHGQGAGQAVHAGAAPAGRDAGPEVAGDRRGGGTVPSGSGARIARRPAWICSTRGWGRGRVTRSPWP